MLHRLMMLRRRGVMHPVAAVLVSAVLSAVVLAFLLACGPASAQSAADPAPEHPATVITAQRDGYTVAALATHLRGATGFKHGVVLFPGYPGIMRLTEENGQENRQPRFALAGNFLVRSRRNWIDDETLVLVVDAPSDQWNNFSQIFRQSPRYGADIAALLQEAGQRYPVAQWTFVGTSEGSISAFHAARMNPGVARLILTASLFTPSRNGPGLSGIAWDELKRPLLWVHHENDPCQYTQYRDARRHAQITNSPLVTVRGGGPWRGDACAAFTAHGFVGAERETVQAMRSWIKTGAVPPDIGP